MNKVMLIGYVGTTPEVKYYEADQAVATLRLATTEKGYTLPNGTRVPERTDWHNLVFYRKLAKIVEKYVHKGDRLYVDGRLQYRQYDDKRGIQRTVSEIIIDNMEMLTSRPSAPQPQPAEVSEDKNEATTVKHNVEDSQTQDKILPF